MSNLFKKMIIVMATIAVVGCAISFIAFEEIALNLTYGIIAGTMISTLNYFLLEISVVRTLNHTDPTKGKMHSILTFTGRFFLTAAAVLAVAFQHPTVHLFGLIFGLVNMQISALICGLLVSREKKLANQGQ